MPVQCVDVIYTDFKFHSMLDVGYSDFGAYRQLFKAIRIRFADTSEAPS